MVEKEITVVTTDGYPEVLIGSEPMGEAEFILRKRFAKLKISPGYLKMFLVREDLDAMTLSYYILLALQKLATEKQKDSHVVIQTVEIGTKSCNAIWSAKSVMLMVSYMVDTGQYLIYKASIARMGKSSQKNIVRLRKIETNKLSRAASYLKKDTKYVKQQRAIKVVLGKQDKIRSEAMDERNILFNIALMQCS